MAPGPAILTFEAIRQFGKWDKASIVGMAEVTIRTGWHSAVWQRPSGVLMCKLSNDYNVKLTAYRTISLVTHVGKVVQKVVV